jgi:AcrR family transcriptional regulator
MGRHAGVDAATTRARILDAAIALVARNGYVATSMSDLATAIRMTQGALYWHFPNKEALLVAAVDELQRRLVNELARAASDDASRSTDLLGVLIERVADVAAEFPTYFRFIGIVTAEATETSPKLEAALRRAFGGVARVLAGVLEEGIRAGTIDEDLDVACTSELFLGLYLGGIMQQRLHRKTLPQSRAMPVLVRMMRSSVAPRARSVSSRSPKR